MSTADVFRIIARSTLRHITANGIMLQRSDSEGAQKGENFRGGLPSGDAHIGEPSGGLAAAHAISRIGISEFESW
jgi:hypothetical protein